MHLRFAYTEVDVPSVPAAGIYEGGGTCHRYFLIVAQKDRWIIDRLRALFGGTVGLPSANLHNWILCGARMRGFAMTIYAFLSPRRRQQMLAKKLLTSAHDMVECT